jgi:hypothetical protein
VAGVPHEVMDSVEAFLTHAQRHGAEVHFETAVRAIAVRELTTDLALGTGDAVPERFRLASHRTPPIGDVSW